MSEELRNSGMSKASFACFVSNEDKGRWPLVDDKIVDALGRITCVDGNCRRLDKQSTSSSRQ